MGRKRDGPSGPREIYEIRVKGHVDSHWFEWFEGLTVAHTESGDTILFGPIVDQSALHGLLEKVRDRGLPLISVNRCRSW